MHGPHIVSSDILSSMELIEPQSAYKDSFIAAVKEYKNEEDTLTTRRYRNLSLQDLESNFDAFVEQERSHALGRNLPENYVPQTELWLVDSGEYIGHVGIRHTLTDRLLQVGGHIGYGIRPSKRREGYGTKILELALPKMRELGIERILVTCDVTNTASRRIIEKNGGVLENQVHNPETGVDKLRFWIDVR